MVIRYRILRAPSKETDGLLSHMPSWSPLSRPTFWYTTPIISVQAVCMLQDDPAFGMNVETLPGPLVAHGQACRKVCCIWLLSIVFKALAECTSGGITDIFHMSFFADQSYTHYFPCFWCAVLLLLSLRWRSVLSFLFWGYRWQSVPHLVWTLVFHFSRHRHGSLSFGVLSCFRVVRVLHFFSELIFSIKLAVEFTRDIGTSFPWCDCLAIVIFHFRDERFLSSRFYAWHTFDASEFPPESAVFFWSSRSQTVPDALLDPLAQFSQLVSVSFRSVSSVLSELSDFIVSFIDLFIFVVLRPRHISCYLCFFLCCCCVCIFTWIVCCCCIPCASSPKSVMFASSPRFVSCCGVCVLIRMVCCCGIRNKSSISLLQNGSCGVCILIQRVCSFRMLQHSRRLSHFRLLCGSCRFGFMLDFSFEFSVALFEKNVCFTRSRLSIVLTLCALCCWDFLLFAVCVLWDFFLRCCSHKLCHVICFSISAATHVFSCPPTCNPPVSLHLSVSCMQLAFEAFFLYLVLSAAKFCIIDHCFIQSPLLFPSLIVCAVQHWHVRHQIRAPIQRWRLLLLGFREFLDWSVRSFNVNVRILRVGEVPWSHNNYIFQVKNKAKM